LENNKKRSKEIEKLEETKRILEECIKAIKGHNYKLAEEKLLLLSDKSQIIFVVKEVFNHQIANFDVLLDFAKDIADNGERQTVLEALYSEMTQNSFNDPLRLINLFKLLQKSQNSKKEFSLNVKDSIQKSATTVLKNAVINRNSLEVTVKGVAQAVFEFDKDMFNNIIKSIISDVYKSHIQRLEFMDWEFNLVDDLRKLFPGTLGKFDSEWRDIRRDLLPSVVNAVAIHSPVCIGSSGFHWCAQEGSPGTRKIKANGNKPGSENCLWMFERGPDNTFWIRNYKYSSEYVYMSESSGDAYFYTSANRRNGIENTGRWILERKFGNNQNFRIENYFRKKYACYYTDSKYLATCGASNIDGWDIIDCTVSNRKKREIHELGLNSTIPYT